MSKKSIFLCSALVAAGSVYGQKLAEGYVKMPESSSLHTYVSAWNSGKGTITMDGKAWEDEEFFISRVKPKTRVFDTNTQVRPDLVQWDANTKAGTDKRYVNWVPINDPAFNAIPNGSWDGEVFSCWSYVDHWGDWTSPYGWVPGAFSDICHKNGVATSGVASVPWGGISDNWKNEFVAISGLDADAVGAFLYYHGVDGLGYNSEWSGYSPSGLVAMHDKLKTYMATRNPLWENIWYAGTTDAGGCSFDVGLSSMHGIYNSSSAFLNYNWNNTSYMTSSINYSEGVGKNPFFIYAGMDQQGSQPKSGNNYSLLKDYKYSIGIWGAHSHNMFWEGRGAFGSSVEATQAGYLDKCERWYTGGSRNPAIKQTIQTIRSHHPVASWAGISSMVSERSVFNWDLTKEPFITYFNLGNGKFFNIEGNRVSNNEWYSIAMQDYMPTWRFWFAPTWKGGQGAGMENTLTASDQTMDAAFTWDEAYFGGSCLKITGSGNQYLHLFKTNYEIGSGAYNYSVTFKILGGKADIDLVLDGFRTNGTTQTYIESKLASRDECADIEDISYKTGKDGWTTVTVSLGTNKNLRKVRMIGLKFANAENLEMLLGGFSIQQGSKSWTTPATPVIKSAKVLANTYTGVDGKIVWEMPGVKPVPTPTYNSDVNTQYFKVYSQEEGGEPTFVGATTSWAAIAFRAPNTDSSKKIRFGVSAVGFDYVSESDIAWSDEYYEKGEYVASDEVVINKKIVKANESFTVGYTDSRHAPSTWTIVDNNGTTVASGSGLSLEVSDGLPLGGYDLYIDKGTDNERVYGYFVQITSEAIGAIPEVYTISNGNVEVSDTDAPVEITLEDTPTLSYTGRKADGSASRALDLNSRHIGAKVADLGLSARQSFSLAGWFNFSNFPEGKWNFVNISALADSYPNDTWGYCWNYGIGDGLKFVFRGSNSGGIPGELHYTFPNTKISDGVWCHIAFVCEYNNTDFRCLLYVNGVKQESSWWQYNSGNSGDYYYDSKTSGYFYNKGTDDWCTSGIQRTLSDNDYIYFGGSNVEATACAGIVDDFQIWGKAMTADEVKQSMNGLDPSSLPADVVAFWDFETDCDENYSFAAAGSKAGAGAYSYSKENKELVTFPPMPVPGCPFLSGTAYPVVTEAKWKDDADRKTQFTAVESRAAATAAEGGAATVKFRNAGDHNVSLTLSNNYGESTKTYPTFVVSDSSQGIGEIGADGEEMTAYTVDRTLFLEFAADGKYEVEVYNAAGMCVGAETLAAVAGQNASITLGAPGVYMVKASLNGKLLRTIKILSK